LTGFGGRAIESRLIAQDSRATVARSVKYGVDGWGVGEIWLDGEVLLWHELPTRAGTAAAPAADALAQRFRSHFAGARDDFADVRLDLDGYTPFQLAIVDVLRRVPYGEVVTYGELAALAGYPNAQRAAGSVCAHNRFPLVVPCHRVVSATGIGGYGTTGVATKRRLLELEGVLL
jgi:methylated-DNA-[protein]-cysteine S-methyltransferase